MFRRLLACLPHKVSKSVHIYGYSYICNEHQNGEPMVFHNMSWLEINIWYSGTVTERTLCQGYNPEMCCKWMVASGKGWGFEWLMGPINIHRLYIWLSSQGEYFDCGWHAGNSALLSRSPALPLGLSPGLSLGIVKETGSKEKKSNSRGSGVSNSIVPKAITLHRTWLTCHWRWWHSGTLCLQGGFKPLLDLVWHKLQISHFTACSLLVFWTRILLHLQ